MLRDFQLSPNTLICEVTDANSGVELVKLWRLLKEGPLFRLPSKAMIGENRQLVTDEPVEFEK